MKKGVYGLLVLLVLAAASFVSASLLGWGCPVQHFTGIPCPGCGLSRAAFALLRLDFWMAFRYNPMIYVLPPVVLLVLFRKKPLLGTEKRERILLWSVMALWAGVWIVRLVMRDPLICGTAA
ncbi:DUF2752 domain-containing protein [uncultured Agathobaculum sp.]|uniref:DUF2752 domain-containing protein n=1 Tax=uncultured Agathobaculum sp. TaxID=2048140 RepID=UPI00320ABA86